MHTCIDRRWHIIQVDGGTVWLLYFKTTLPEWMLYRKSAQTYIKDRYKRNSWNWCLHTLVVMATGLLRGTTSLSCNVMTVIEVFPSLNSTMPMPAKSFLRCTCMTCGLVDWPRISSRSSSPMKKYCEEAAHFSWGRRGGFEGAGGQKRRTKRKEMQKAGSHQVRNARGVSGANAQHQCYEVANPCILRSY